MSNNIGELKRSSLGLYIRNIVEAGALASISATGVVLIRCASRYKGTHTENAIITVGAVIAALPLLYYAFKYAPLYDPRPESDT